MLYNTVYNLTSAKDWAKKRTMALSLSPHQLKQAIHTSSLSNTSQEPYCMALFLFLLLNIKNTAHNSYPKAIPYNCA